MPGKENLWPHPCEQPIGRRAQHIEAQQHKQDGDEPGRALFGTPDTLYRASAGFDGKPPQQDRPAHQLDDAVQPESDQQEAASQGARPNGRHGLDDHPGQAEVLDAHTGPGPGDSLVLGRAGIMQKGHAPVLGGRALPGQSSIAP